MEPGEQTPTNSSSSRIATVSMSFVLILAFLATWVLAEYSPPQPVEGAGARLFLALAGMSLVVLFALGSSFYIARQLRRHTENWSAVLRRFQHLRHIHTMVWLAVGGAIVYGLDWSQVVRYNWQLKDAFLIDDVLLFSPWLLPLLLSWSAFYEVERALLKSLQPVNSPMPVASTEGKLPSASPNTYSSDVCTAQQPKIDGVAREQSQRTNYWTRWQYVKLHARHYLGLSLLPFFLLLLVQDTVWQIAPNVLQSDWAFLIYIPPLLLLFAYFPVFLSSIWETQPLTEGALYDRLLRCAQRVGFTLRPILVWQTHGAVTNAAVAGFLPSSRYVFLTDGLLERLSPEEIEAIFGHELGHIRHQHLWLRLLAMVAPLCLWLLFFQLFPHSAGHLQQWLDSGGPWLHAQIGLLTLATMGIYTLVVFGYYSRLLEHQADLFGCRVLVASAGNEARDIFATALKKLATASGRKSNSGDWQHASVVQRISFLHALENTPKKERHFQRQLLCWRVGLMGIALSPLLLPLLLA